MSAAVEHVPEHVVQTSLGGYRVRVARPSDEDRLRRMLEAAAPEDIRFRFFRHLRTLPHAVVEPLTRVDESRHFAFVAEPAGDSGCLVASAMMVADPDGRSAEFGIFVARDHRDHGLGTHLLDCLQREARAHGIAKIHGLILADNGQMLDLARYYGFAVGPDPDDPHCARAELVVPAGPAAAP